MCVLTAEADIDTLLEEKVAAIRKEVVLVTEDLYAQERAIIRKQVGSLEDEIALLKNQLMHLAAEQGQSSMSQIAFSVVSHEDFTIVGSNIDYNVTYINIGGAWHNQTHTFQAPVAGVYYFTTSCRAVYGVGNTYVNIVVTTAVDQTIVASLFGNGNPLRSGDANSVILQLDALDYVSVHLDAGAISSTASEVQSTFSGFLLFQL